MFVRLLEAIRFCSTEYEVGTQLFVSEYDASKLIECGHAEALDVVVDVPEYSEADLSDDK